MLVATDHPLVLHRVVGDVLRAVLNAGVVGGVAAEGETQVEVADLASLPDQERVARRHVLGRGLAMDHAVLHGPQPGITIPAVEILAVEELLHVGRLRRGGRGNSGWRLGAGDGHGIRNDAVDKGHDDDGQEAA